jgi:uncharacterized OB-fold protein
MSTAPTPRIPSLQGLHAEFYRQALGGTLHVQRCDDCDAYQHPPRYRCTWCGSPDVTWQPVTGDGHLYSWTVTHVPFDRGWAPAIPYATGLVELDEGVRLIGSLGQLDPALLRIGLPVTTELRPMDDDFVFLEFRPRGD